MNNLPLVHELFTPAEVSVTLDQELRLADDRKKEARWFGAPCGTPPPDMLAHQGAFINPWIVPWAQLNDPAEDDMDGVAVLDERDQGVGLLALRAPTREAKRIWQSTFWPLTQRQDGRPPAVARLMLGVELPDRSHRAVFYRVAPIEPLPFEQDVLRFAIERPLYPDSPSYEVWMSGGSVRHVRSL